MTFGWETKSHTEYGNEARIDANIARERKTDRGKEHKMGRARGAKVIAEKG
jgi:hypothetical protein